MTEYTTPLATAARFIDGRLRDGRADVARPLETALAVCSAGQHFGRMHDACLTGQNPRITVGDVLLKAKVRGGRLLLDEPTDLPEGTEVELTPVLDDDLDAAERRALESSLARSAAQLARNDLVDADEVLRGLGRPKR